MTQRLTVAEKLHDKMITIQGNRVKQGKRGYAKAVRRYLKATFPDTYQEEKAKLPVFWSK